MRVSSLFLILATVLLLGCYKYKTQEDRDFDRRVQRRIDSITAIQHPEVDSLVGVIINAKNKMQREMRGDTLGPDSTGK